MAYQISHTKGIDIGYLILDYKKYQIWDISIRYEFHIGTALLTIL